MICFVNHTQCTVSPRLLVLQNFLLILLEFHVLLSHPPTRGPLASWPARSASPSCSPLSPFSSSLSGSTSSSWANTQYPRPHFTRSPGSHDCLGGYFRHPHKNTYKPTLQGATRNTHEKQLPVLSPAPHLRPVFFIKSLRLSAHRPSSGTPAAPSLANGTCTLEAYGPHRVMYFVGTPNPRFHQYPKDCKLGGRGHRMVSLPSQCCRLSTVLALTKSPR